MRRTWCLLGLAALALSPAAQAAYQVGDHINDFTLADEDGVSHSLYDYSGDILVINWFQLG